LEDILLYGICQTKLAKFFLFRAFVYIENGFLWTKSLI